MNKLYFLLLVTTLSVLTSCSNNDDPNGWDIYIPDLLTIEFSESETTANSGVNDFSVKFFNQSASDFSNGIIKNASGNLSVSPLSATLALGMLANTGDSDLENKIVNLLGSDDLSSLNSTCNKLMRYLPNSQNRCNLSLANSAWYNSTLCRPSSAWTDNLNKVYYASTSGIPFENEQSIDIINSWCAQKTNNMIPRIIDTLNPESYLTLANALYFSGYWVKSFDAKYTVKQEFHGKDRDILVDMMKKDASYRVGISDDFIAIRIGFVGSNTMIFMLPSKNITALELAEKLTSDDFFNVRNFCMPTDVHLSLPKFNVNMQCDITHALQNLGLPTECKLNGMGLDDIITPLLFTQHTATSIDEEEAKAAAVTVIHGDTAPGPLSTVDEITITFDRPFIYYIENDKTGSILMAGVINNL